MSDTKICPQCGEEFLPNRANRKYCSKACQVRATNANKLKPLTPKICKTCGKEFLPKCTNQKYCSRACHPSYNKIPKHSHICEICGQHFENQKQYSKTCNDCLAALHAQGTLAGNRRRNYPMKHYHQKAKDFDNRLKLIHEKGLTYAQFQTLKLLYHLSDEEILSG